MGDQSKPDRKAIPTLYRGVQFRSRLEAKWAAFFDAMGWPWQYEPFDLAGWIPDFLIGRHIVAEIKPVTSYPNEVIREIDAALPVERDIDGRYEWPQCEPIVLGCTVPVVEHPYWGFGSELGVPIGWMRAAPANWRRDREPRWDLAAIGKFHKKDWYFPDPATAEMKEFHNEWFGLFHIDDSDLYQDPGYESGRENLGTSAHDRIVDHFPDYIVPWGACHWDVANPNERDRPDRLAGPVIDAWNNAANLTQWRGVRSVVR